MEKLSQCPDPRRRHRLYEPETGQGIVFEVPQGWELAIYHFRPQTDFWPGDKSPDAVMLVRHPKGQKQETIVCFVELKTTAGKKDQGTRSDAHQQLEMGLSHFMPRRACGEPWLSHGDQHHRQWSEGRDWLDVWPDKNHRVVALLVAFRHGTRRPGNFTGEPQKVCGKRVRFCVIPLSQHSPRTLRINLETFCSRATIIPYSQGA